MQYSFSHRWPKRIDLSLPTKYSLNTIHPESFDSGKSYQVSWRIRSPTQKAFSDIHNSSDQVTIFFPLNSVIMSDWLWVIRIYLTNQVHIISAKHLKLESRAVKKKKNPHAAYILINELLSSCSVHSFVDEISFLITHFKSWAMFDSTKHVSTSFTWKDPNRRLRKKNITSHAWYLLLGWLNHQYSLSPVSKFQERFYSSLPQ